MNDVNEGKSQIKENDKNIEVEAKEDSEELKNDQDTENDEEDSILRSEDIEFETSFTPDVDVEGIPITEEHSAPVNNDTVITGNISKSVLMLVVSLKKEIKNISVHPSHRYIAVSVATGAVIIKISAPEKEKKLRSDDDTFIRHSNTLSVQWGRDTVIPKDSKVLTPNTSLFICTRSCAREYNLRTNALISKTHGNNISSFCIKMIPNGILSDVFEAVPALGSNDNGVLIGKDGRRTMLGNHNSVRAMDGRSSLPLIAAASDNGCYILRVAPPNSKVKGSTGLRILPLTQLKRGTIPMLSIQFYPNQPYVLTGGGDGIGCLWV